MYSPLPDRPAAGPVTRNPLAAPLRGTLRMFNAALGAVGIVTLAAALYMFIIYHRTGLLPPDGPPPPLSPPPGSNNSTASGGPWFIYFVGGLGAFILAVSSSGMAGLQPENRRRLFFYIILLTGFILAEAAALVILFTDNPVREKIPEDVTGNWPRVLEFIDNNARIVKLAALSVILAELVGLGAACWLHSMYQAAYEDWLDGIEAAQARTMDQLGRAAEDMYSGAGASTWNSRIKEKYGLKSSEWDAEAAIAAAVQAGGLVEQRGSM